VLWQAFTADRPVALLIDEIDKADIEFPNDLLRELDRMEFYCYETRELIKAKHRPLVFITSNNEKELPDAFLRRCFFHYIKFPDADTMKQIVNVHFPGLKDELLTAAMKTFYDVRNLPGLKKKPSTRAARLAQAADGRGHSAGSPAECRQQGLDPAAGGRAAEERAGHHAVREAGVHEPEEPVMFVQPVVPCAITASGWSRCRRRTRTDCALPQPMVNCGRSGSPRCRNPKTPARTSKPPADAGRRQHRLRLPCIDEPSGRVVGSTSYHDILPAVRRVEIGYTWYARSVQRSHINTTCKLLMMGHAFDALDCAVVGWRTDNFNFASQRAIERLGAKKDGVIRGHALRRDGTVRDTVMYSMSAGEWPEAKAQLLYLRGRHA
jgi:RimJ/RimL family protein N-acetyltransferase